MVKTLFMFPGQGSQKVGMGKDLYDNYPVAKQVIDEVDSALGFSLSDIMFNGPMETLSLARHVQPAIMAVSIATLKVLEELSGEKLSQMTDFVAGHSLGEYTALCAAGSLTLEQTAKILHARGFASDQCVEDGIAGMSAILGLELSQVQEICDEVSKNEDDFVSVANYNCPGQIVISGYKTGLEKAGILAKEKGAKRAMPLPVSTPTHSMLMEDAGKAIELVLSGNEIKTPSVKFISNNTGLVENDMETSVKQQLTAQMTNGVNWVRLFENAKSEYSITRFVECGQANVLSTLAKRMKGENDEIITLDSEEKIKEFAAA